MTVLEKERFLLSTLRPMAEHTLPYICQVAGTDTGRDGHLVGSGFRCILNGRRRVVTAGHVIREGFSRYPRLVISSGNARRPYAIHGEIRGDVSTDLGLYDAPDDYSVAAGCSFWPEARIDRTLELLPRDYLFIHGFPMVRSESLRIPGGSRVMSRSLPYGVMQRTEGLPDDMRDFQFAVDFDPSNCQAAAQPLDDRLFGPEEVEPGPRGLSGSPVWRIGVSGRRAAEWEPGWAMLVGVVTQWRPAEQLLIATKITKLLELAGMAREGS